jgi:sterol desaturase/sphingolipid hydroxylase (fatty acid hydroxylase superfamily)
MNGDKLFEAMTLVAVVLLFDFFERRRPGHAVDRRWEMPVNLLSIATVIVAGEIWKEFLLKEFTAVDLARLLSPAGLYRLPPVVKMVLGIILADFSLYWVHRGMHWNKLLWRTHAFHHSIEHLWWLSGSRTSVTHLFLFAFPQVFIASSLFRLTPLEAGAVFSFGVAVNVWIHTNLWVNIGPLAWLLITPNYHRIHHGSRGLLRTNLGFVFTIWDRMFGTYADPHAVGKDFAMGFVPTRNRLLRMIIGF